MQTARSRAELGVKCRVAGLEIARPGIAALAAPALEGGKTFHLFVGPPRTSQHGQFNPSTMGLEPVAASYFDEQGVGFLADIAYSDAFTLIDLRELQPVLGDRIQDFAARSTRVIHGFDAMLVLSGATPAVML